MKRLIFTLLVCALMATPTLANPSFGDGGAALQGVIDGITTIPLGASTVNVATDALSDTLDSTWAVQGSGGAFETIIAELAAWAGGNSFGVYDAANPGTMVQLFAGANVPGDTTTLSILATGEVRVGGVDSGVFFAGNAFGWYLDSTLPRKYDQAGNEWYGGVWKSDSTLNSDLADHMGAYQGTGDEIQILPFSPGTWASDEYILAFEDLDLQHWGNQDGTPDVYPEWGDLEPDYTDFVVIVESIEPIIPAPGAIILGSLGVGLVGWLRRRRTL